MNGDGASVSGCRGTFTHVGRLFGLRTWVCDSCGSVFTRVRPRPFPPKHS